MLAAIARAQAAHPQFRIEEFGDASARRAISQAFEEDARRAEFLSLPITLLILVAAFGALVAAGIPLLLGLTAVVATVGLLGPVSRVIPLADAVSSVVLLVGLAVGVDYSMFYIRRMRDERAAGRSDSAALAIAAATSGRAVLDLRADGARRDVRHVRRRPSRLLVVRDRDDDGRGRRDGRFDHGRSRDAGRAWATGSTWAACRSRVAVAAPASRACGRRSSAASWAGRGSPPARRRPCSSSLRRPRCASTPPTPARRRCRAISRSCAPMTASSAPSRAVRCRP